MGDPASPIRYVRRSERWLDLVASGPIAVPPELLAIPGIRYVEPEFGHPDPIWKLEIPSTTWMLPDVYGALPKATWPLIGMANGSAIVPEWPSLYKYQQDAIQFLIDQRGGLLGLSVGMGKSRPAAIAAWLLAARAPMNGVNAETARTGHFDLALPSRSPAGATKRPVLIVAPKYLRATWEREIKLALGDQVTFQALAGITPYEIAATDFIFIHYDIVHAWWSQIVVLRPGAAILDEAHTIRNARTRRGRAAQLVCSVAPFRLLLSGTPILNRPGELLPLLELVTGKWTWGSPSRFRERYCSASRSEWGWVDGLPSNTEEFRVRLSSVMFRRTIDEIGIDLPPVTREVIYVDLSDKDRVRYAELFEGYTADDVIDAVLHNRGSKKTFEWLGKLRKIASDAKFNTTKDLLDGLQAEGESAVVFAWRRATVEKLAVSAVAVHSSYIHGECSQATRDVILAEFQRSGGRLAATYDSLSTGVTLDKARVVVLHDLDWVPATMLQAAGRVTGGLRRGTRTTVEKWMVARGTLDELMIRLVGLKGNTIEQLVTDRAASELASLLGYEEKQGSLEKVITWARSI